MAQQRIVTIQDISCFGRCSLGVALPIISSIGIEACPLPTAVLSTHTGGFGSYTFTDLTQDIPKIQNHWQTLDIKFDGIYTGYLGSLQQINLTENFIKSFKNENTLVMIDPVMADFGKLYAGFDSTFPQCMAKLCRCADVIVPNLTEACLLTNSEYIEACHTKEYIQNILQGLAELGAKKIIITGIELEKGKIGPVAYDTTTGETFYYGAKKVDNLYHGTGDVFSSAIFGCLVKGIALERAIALATDFTVDSILRSYHAKTDNRYGVNFEEGLCELAQKVASAI